jgi:hypothetical protein
MLQLGEASESGVADEVNEIEGQTEVDYMDEVQHVWREGKEFDRRDRMTGKGVQSERRLDQFRE